jgi:predicted kinase
MNNTLTIIVGLPRSGKSTWIGKNKGDAIVLSHDWVREHILGVSYAKSANAIVWTIADATLRILLGQDKNVILDGVNNTRSTRKFYIDIAKEYGAKVKMLVITTPLSVCLARNRMSDTHKLPDEALIHMDKTLELPQEGEYDEIEYYEGFCKHDFKLTKVWHDAGSFIQGYCKICKLDIEKCGFTNLTEDKLWDMYEKQEGIAKQLMLKGV